MLLLATQLFFGQATFSLEPNPGEDYTNFYSCPDSEIMVKTFKVHVQPNTNLSLFATAGFEFESLAVPGIWVDNTYLISSNESLTTYTINIRLAQGGLAGRYSGEVTIYDAGNAYTNLGRKAENKSGAARIAESSDNSLFVSGEIATSCQEECTTPAAPTVYNYGSNTICSNYGTTLYASNSYEGDYTVYYSWYKDGELISDESSYPYFYPYYGSGTYTSKVTINGCTSEASEGIEITILEAPATPRINGEETQILCPGSSITLTTSFEEYVDRKQTNSTSRISDSEESRYIWYKRYNDDYGDYGPFRHDDEYGIRLDEEGSSLTVTEPGEYFVKFVNANGCESRSSSYVTVMMGTQPTTPIISASGNVSFCEGGNVTLTSTPSTSYRWSNGATTRSITVNNSALYTVVVNNGTCNSIASIGRRVTVNPIPKSPTISTSGTTTLCAGKTVTLTSSATTGNRWSNGANTQSITVSTAGTYTVTATNLGCTSPRSLGTTVTVNAIPTRPTITASGTTTFCAGGSVTLTSSSENNIWSNGSTEKSIIVSSAGNYSVKTNNNGCESLSSASKSVVVNALPAAPTITVIGSTNLATGGNVTLTSSYASANKWSTGSTLRSIIVNKPGTYTVSFMGATCMSKPSLPVTITQNAIENTARFSNSSENETTSFSSKMSIYPNPSKGIFNIETDTAGDVYIMNQLGQVVKEVKVDANVVNTINAENLAKGIYLVKQSNKSQASKLIIQN